MRSSGQPLDAATRALMEPRFGHDFSQVRVHTDAHAGASALALNALAFTVVAGRGVRRRPVFAANSRRVTTRLMPEDLAESVAAWAGEGEIHELF